MKNVTTKEFCRKFSACMCGTKFALHYATMRECYSALLQGEAGENSYDWAFWAATQEGVMTERDLRLFAVKCARRVQHLMTDKRSIHALDVAERYANGDASREELNAAVASAREAVDATAAAWEAELAEEAATDAAWAAAAWVAPRAVWKAKAADDADVAEERAAQFAILAEFGNPFEEVEE